MLPCNVLVQERPGGEIEVSAIDPIASMAAASNDDLGEVATQVREKLRRVIEAL